MDEDERFDRDFDEDFPDSEPPDAAGLRASLERLIPELVRRGVEAGRGTLHRTETLRGALGDTRLPRELAGYIAGQLDEARSGVVRGVSSEVRRFLRDADLGHELAKVLTSLSFEIKAQVRFVPNEEGYSLRPRVSTRAYSHDEQASDEEPAAKQGQRETRRRGRRERRPESRHPESASVPPSEPARQWDERDPENETDDR